MKRLALVLVVAAAVASPARAAPDDLLECIAQQVTPAFRGKIADAMLAPESAEADGLFLQLAAVADTCAVRHGLGKDKSEAYFTYAMARLPHDAFATRLGDAGISAAVLDEALDYGPGRTNPVITSNLEPDQLKRIGTALEANGVAVDAIQGSTWQLVGAYAAATSLMWQSRAQLP